MSTFKNALIEEFLCATGTARRELLTKLGRNKVPLTLGDFRGAPALSPPFVVDHDDDLVVTSYPHGVRVAARHMGMDLYDPVPVQDLAGEVEHYEVWAETGGTTVLIGTGKTEMEAEMAAERTASEVVGSMVVALPEWAASQALSPVGSDAPARRSGATWAQIEQVELGAKWLAASVYSYEIREARESRRVRKSEAISCLADYGTFKRLEAHGRSSPKFTITVVRLEMQVFAPYHDLVTAARHGVMLPNVQPWPNVGPNRHVIEQEFTRYMRAKGWRTPWRGETTAGGIKVLGRVWYRALPLPSVGDEPTKPSLAA